MRCSALLLTAVAAGVFSLTGATSVTAEADDLPRGDFFPRDFARNPLGNEAGDPALLRREREAPDEGRAEESDASRRKAKTPSMKAPPPSQRAGGVNPVFALPHSGRSARVIALSAIVGGSDPSKIERALVELGRTAKDRKLPVRSLIFVGNGDVVGKLVDRLFEQEPETGIQIMDALKVVDRVPSRYGVTESPSWILETEAGVAVVEGSPSPAEYVSESGALLGKSGAVDALDDAKEEEAGTSF